jgi:hypothetical protein
MTPEDYEEIHFVGFEPFYYERCLQRISDLTPEDVTRVVNDLMLTGTKYLEGLHERDINSLFVANDCHPFFKLSPMRSLLPFTQDLYSLEKNDTFGSDCPAYASVRYVV